MTNVNPFNMNVAQANTTSREPSKFWLNIGQIASDGSFVSFFGLPYDSIKPFRSSNEEYNAIRNAGLAVFNEQFEALKAGETKIVELNGLALQLRHVGEASTAVDESAVNNLRALFG